VFPSVASQNNPVGQSVLYEHCTSGTVPAKTLIGLIKTPKLKNPKAKVAKNNV
jgi:hypothetical protein